MNVKDRYYKLPIKEKIILYLLPLLVLYFIYINLDKFNSLFNKNDPQIENEIKKYKQLLKKLNKNKKINKFELLAKYETIAKEFKVEISSVKFEKNKLFFTAKGKFSGIIKFLYNIEHINKIGYIEILKEDKAITIYMVVNVKSFKNTQTIKMVDKTILNPYKLKDKAKKKEAIAIFDKYILLNGKWLKEGDIYNGKKIIKIKNNSYILQNNKEIFIDKE